MQIEGWTTPDDHPVGLGVDGGQRRGDPTTHESAFCSERCRVGEPERLEIGQLPDRLGGHDLPTLRDSAARPADATTLGEASVILGDIQAAQLIAFVVAMTVLLLALEIGMRRAQRRR
jgi:hypothetical protein